ncbi:trichohyalin [Nematostella vectensis]|uniref:trichohyalin n=1 Tax=Nematostella vectensis TaxID=45351 RepID=UPI0013905901|nr:trichohyalin [Nematostella vectensis]
MEGELSRESTIALPEISKENTSFSNDGRLGHTIRLPSICETVTSYYSDNSMTSYDASEFGEVWGVPSEFGFTEEDSISHGWPERRKDAMLEEEEEREIEQRVQKEFKEEFQKIKMQAREKQVIIRKKFKSKINKARAALLTARINAEKETINKLEKEAERKEAEVLQRRFKRKMESNSNWDLIKDPADITHNMKDLAALRKIRSELDRARARRRSTIASTLVANRHGKMTLDPRFMDTEIKKLERVDEIQKLVHELQSLGLKENANTLISSLVNKKRSEEQLKESLIEERNKAKMRALERKEQEVMRLRQEKIAGKEEEERLKKQREKEEKERLERERRARMMKALERKAFNQSLKRSLEEAKFVTSLSRPYTYSYF